MIFNNAHITLYYGVLHFITLSMGCVVVTYRCSSKVTSGPTEPLSLGGLSNIFSIPTGQITARDFVGCIGAVIISNQQLDISCPATSQGTLRGCRQHGSCSEECTGQSSCVKYTLEPYCKCNGGFTGEACAPTTGIYMYIYIHSKIYIL